MTNFDDYQDEHLALKAKLITEQEALKEAQDAWDSMLWRAQQENERFDLNKKRRYIYEGIVVFAKQQTKLEVSLDNDNEITIGGIDVRWNLHIKEEYTSVSSWRSKPTGRLRVVTGDFGSQTSYPQRKDGSFNYSAIADKLIAYAEKKILEKKWDAQRAANRDHVKETLIALGIESNYGVFRVESSATPDAPVFVKAKIEQAMTKEQAIALGNALKALGIKIS